METETKPPAPTDSPETTSGERMIYYPIHPKMRMPYLVAGYIFVGLSLMLAVIQIIAPPQETIRGDAIIIIATIIFSSYLIYTANSKTTKVDAKHAGIQFWISLGAACGFITISLGVAWLLAKIITA